MGRRAQAIWRPKYNHWRVQVQANGERATFYSNNPQKAGKAEAEGKADEWLKGIRKGKDCTFDELAKSYLAHLRTANGTAHKSREQATIELYLSPVFGSKKVSALTNLDYQTAIDKLVEGREKPLSVRSCGHVRTTIKALYTHAKKAEIRMTEPFGLTIPTGATKGQRTVLQPDDIRKLFGADLDKVYNIDVFRLIVLTGLRPGEVCGLKTDDLKGNTLTVNRAINTKGETTTGKNENARRSIILSDFALKVIEAHQKKAPASDWLLPNKRGGAISTKTLYNAWRRLCKDTGLPPVSLYELRHTMISVCKEVPLPLLKQVVGHSESMDTLGTYGHQMDGEQQQAADLIAASFAALLQTNGV